jgi:hypothetical protein
MRVLIFCGIRMASDWYIKRKTRKDFPVNNKKYSKANHLRPSLAPIV